MDTLELLFKRRFNGAVNIRGIEYQILVSLDKALDLFKEKKEDETITLEGIEDLDLKGIYRSDTYIQVKTSEKPWKVHQYEDVITKFDIINTLDKDVDFNIVINFPINENIKKIFSTNILDSNLSIRDKFINRIVKKGYNYENIKDIIFKTTIVYLPNDILIINIKRKLIEVFELSFSSVDIFYNAFIAFFIDLSIERKTISKLDISKFYIELQTCIERKNSFASIFDQSIEKIDWYADKNINDYYEGKKTRPGHIVKNLDVKRPRWIEAIDKVFINTKVCIIKEASGQGKSTIALRYIYDKWDKEYVYKVKYLKSDAQVDEVILYFKDLIKLGIPLSVFIDDIGYDLRFYSRLISISSSLGIYSLITIRNEDFSRFNDIEYVNYDIVMPFLDLNEAKIIFKNLFDINRIHSSVKSAEEAYELINSPKSLIEYIFLITQGAMLHDRLVGQIQVMRKLKETYKINLLRKIMLAISCFVPIKIEKVIHYDSHDLIDIQGVIKELTNEFICVDDGYINGYHWVRSNHLLNILHDNYANPCHTALDVIKYIDENYIEKFISGVTNIENFKFEDFASNLYKYYNTKQGQVILDIIKGFFKIGEFMFYMKNKYIFDKAYNEYNDGSLFLLQSSCNATTNNDSFMNMIKVLPENENFNNIKVFSEQISLEFRGFDLVRIYINSIDVKYLFSEMDDISTSENILDWIFWAKPNIRILPSDLLGLLNNNNIFNIDIDRFSILCLSVFRLNESIFKEWYKVSEARIYTKIQDELSCLLINNELSLSVVSKITNDMNISYLIYDKIQKIRMILPFYLNYKGYNTEYDFSKINISNIDQCCRMFKDILIENIHPFNDISKNRVLLSLLYDRYSIKTWYEFELSYYNLRRDIVAYMHEFICYLTVTNYKFKYKNSSQISDSILHSPKRLILGFDDSSLNDDFTKCIECFNTFNAFLVMKSDYISNNNDMLSLRNIFLNLNNFIVELRLMHKFFYNLKKYAPIYFDFSIFNNDEINSALRIKQLLKKNLPYSYIYCDHSDYNEA